MSESSARDSNRRELRLRARRRAVNGAYAALLVSFLLGVCAFASTRARADVGALLPVVVEHGTRSAESVGEAAQSELETDVHEAVLGYFARLPDAIPLTPPDAGIERAGEPFRGCSEASCASEYARALAVDLAVVVQLLAPSAEAPEDRLRATLVTSEGHAHTGEVRVDERGVGDATVRAVGLAYERWRRGPTRVEPARTDARPAVQLRVPEARRDGEASSYWQRKRSKWNYIVGVPIAAVGVFYTVVGAMQFAARGSCAEEVAGQCTREKTVDAGSRAALALGLVGIAVGGGGFLAAGIVRERERADGAWLHLRGRF